MGQIMSRIRTIKPEFWTSEQIIACSTIARLLFIGMFNFADDNGVHPASYIRLKAEIFPGDNFTTTEIKQWVDELINNRLIQKYIVEDKAYLIITGWKNHQKIEKPTYRHPLPQNDTKQIANNSTTIHQVVADMSTTTPLIFDDSSATESKGMESKGMEVITKCIGKLSTKRVNKVNKSDDLMAGVI
jgi:hypothetical protein